MENFYQESGRAGRDNKPAKCILLYKFSDIARLSTMVFTEQTGLEKLYGIIAYSLNNSSCRRKIIAEHFGEDWDSTQCSEMCDTCLSSKNASNSLSSVNVSDIGKKHALKIYDQFALNTSCFWWKYWITNLDTLTDFPNAAFIFA